MPKMKKGDLSADKVKGIKSYANKIVSLSDFEAIRKRPGEFIGYIGRRGFRNMAREIIQNTFDEIQKEDSPCTTGSVSYDERTKEIVVLDNGKGIPYGEMLRIFTDTNTGSNFIPQKGVFASGMHGVGSKVVNALSHTFIVDSYMCSIITGGKPLCHHIEFKEGVVWNKKGLFKGEEERPNKDDFQGTRVSFTPSEEVLGEVNFTCDDLLDLLSKLVPLTKIGTNIEFHGIRIDGSTVHKNLLNQDGILTYIIGTIDKPLIAPIVMSALATDLTKKAEMAFTFDINNIGGKAVIYSFANACPTGEGISDDAHISVHTKAFVDEVSSYFRTYMNRVFLSNMKSKIKVIADDIISAGLNAVINVAHINPIFSGQAKEIFSNDDMGDFVKEVIRAQLDEWVKNHPDDLQKLCKYLKQVAELRLKDENNRQKIVLKSRSVIDGLPEKYEKPTGRSNLELVIVEGDSAMGPARTARDPKRQGIYPIRGKFKNALDHNRSSYFDNEETVGLRSLLGSGDGKSFDIKKCPFDKVIVMADADVDGEHIRQLLCKTMIVYYRPLIEEGRFYFANPPLYSVTIGKDKTIYFTNMDDYVAYVLKGFMKDVVVTDDKGRKIPTTDLRRLIVANHALISLIESCCSTFSVDAFLLEFILRYRNAKMSKINKELNKINPYMHASLASINNKSICYDGLTNDKIQTVIYNEFMEHRCSKVIDLLDTCPFTGFKVNGKQTTLLGLMYSYNKYQPSRIQRYKGLGEMDSWELMESTLHPDYNRTLMRVTCEDIDREIKAIRNYNSNKRALVDMVDFSGYEL